MRGGGGAERGLFTDSRSTIKKEEGGGSSPENMSYLRWCGGGSRRGRARKDRHSSTQRPKLSPTTAGHFSGTFSSGWGSERAGGGRGQPLSNVDSVETTREYHCS